MSARVQAAVGGVQPEHQNDDKLSTIAIVSINCAKTILAGAAGGLLQSEKNRVKFSTYEFKWAGTLGRGEEVSLA